MAGNITDRFKIDKRQIKYSARKCILLKKGRSIFYWRLSKRLIRSCILEDCTLFATRARVVPGVVWWKEKSGGEVWSPKKSDVFRAHLSAKLLNKVWQLELLLSQATNPEYFLERKTNHKVASVLGRQKYYSRKIKVSKTQGEQSSAKRSYEICWKNKKVLRKSPASKF